MSKLLLVDGSAVLHRAYHAYPPLTDKAGNVVGAVYGVASILISAIESEKPTHVMVAWDLPKPTFRHLKYVGYKAQRPKADTEMVEQIPEVKSVIEAMKIVQVEKEGFEADDIIGSLSKLGSEDNDVVILTGDQDTMQLVNEHVRILTPAKGANPPVLYGVDEVKNKYGVTPEQIVDYKALIGDTSDNIPGVAGIGPKGASTLLNLFGTLENVYANLEKISNEKLKEKLIAGKDSAFLSQDLSRIVTEMNLEEKLPEMEYAGVANEELRVKLDELGFKSLIRRIFPGALDKKKINDNQMSLF